MGGLLGEDGESGAHPALCEEGLEGEEEHGGPEALGADREDPGRDREEAARHRHRHLHVAPGPPEAAAQAVTEEATEEGGEGAAAGDDGGVDEAEDSLLGGEAGAEVGGGPAPDRVARAEAERCGQEDELHGARRGDACHGAQNVDDDPARVGGQRSEAARSRGGGLRSVERLEIWATA